MPIRRRVPTVFVVVIQRIYDVPGRVLDRNLLAAIRQGAAEESKRRQAWIPDRPSRRIIVRRQHDARPRRNRGTGREDVIDAVEAVAAEVQRRGADILQDQVFVSVATHRIVHNLRNPNRGAEFRDLEDRFRQGAPIGAEKCARFHDHRVTEHNRRACISDRARSNRARPELARVTGIKGVVNIIRRGHRQRVIARHTSAVLTEHRRGVAGIQASRLELVQHHRCANREILRQQAIHLRQPVIISGVKEVGSGLVLVHVAAVIAPARGLGNDGQIKFRHAPGPTLGVRLRHQRAAIEQMLVRPIRKCKPILRAVDKAGMQSAGHIRIAYAIVVRTDDQLFAVPRNVFELAIRRPAADCVPVAIIAPILVGAEEVEQHVIGEVGHIKII